MTNCLQWILLLILPNMLVTLPLDNYQDFRSDSEDPSNVFITLRPENTTSFESNNQIISVRITSSVAIGRGNKYTLTNSESSKTKTTNKPYVETDRELINQEDADMFYNPVSEYYNDSSTAKESENVTTEKYNAFVSTQNNDTEISLSLRGANLDFIKQLNSRTPKSNARDLSSVEPMDNMAEDLVINKTEEAPYEFFNSSDVEIFNSDRDYDELPENIPVARSVSSQTFKNIFEDAASDGQNRKDNEKISTVNFDVIHDLSNITPKYNSQNDPNVGLNSNLQNFYNNPKDYSQPAQIYSEPAQLYSEPAKLYSEPAKFYSEPAKIYSEPAKIYSEPAKVYSEPAKYYSEPASLHLPHNIKTYSSWKPYSQELPVSLNNVVSSTTPLTPSTTANMLVTSRIFENKENNYEVDEKISVSTNGRAHGIQEPAPENCKQENCKVGYVVEGRQYRKYRVEERTSDGFIVGEYGVVRNVDGALRGVRYTADSEASPRLIYDALMKFLQL